MKTTLLFFLFILVAISVNAQCNIPESAIESDEFPYRSAKARYIFNAPSYIFAPGGDTSRVWNLEHKPISLTRLPAPAVLVQNMVEDTIKAYSGNVFFDDLVFDNVEIVYPDRKNDFGFMNFQRYKLKYWFTYRLEVDNLHSLPVGIGVYDDGTIAVKLNMPKRVTYKRVIKNVNYCELASVASHTNKALNESGRFVFQFDEQHGFRWLVLQKLVKNKIKYNRPLVYINAADFSDVKASQIWQEYAMEDVKILNL